MPKRKSQDLDKECPICGGVIWGGGEKVIIEGARITVCQSCAQHGKKIIPSQKSRSIAKGSKTKPSKYSQSNKSHIKRYLEPDLVIVDDYDQRIRRAREKNNLTQAKFAQRLHEKESLIRRIEAKKAKPTIELAKKLEKTYNITLLKESDVVSVNTDKYLKKKTSSSLGDIAFIKKKKK